ncbi:MAG TPA: hypothetical protein VFA63_00630 [Pseudonocardiaceae bacterium]|jgi:hypothetical protein|nr:hypothetical protein [Pseudonocardiaceae bacterium]
MTAPLAVACAVTFVWLGMVLAISFLEAPLKFRAPEVTLRIGLGIGRLVFGALNIVEAVFAATLLVCIIIAPAAAWIITSVLVAVVILGIQLVLVRPRLARRTNRILAGAQAPRSGGHHAYVVLETGKCIMLIISGVLLLST